MKLTGCWLVSMLRKLMLARLLCPIRHDGKAAASSWHEAVLPNWRASGSESSGFSYTTPAACEPFRFRLAAMQ